MIKKNNVEKERNRYKTKTTGASLVLLLSTPNLCFDAEIRILSVLFGGKMP